VLDQVPLGRDVKPSYLKRANRIEDRLRLSVTSELRKCDKSNAWFYAVTAFASVESPPILLAANRLVHAIVSRVSRHRANRNLEIFKLTSGFRILARLIRAHTLIAVVLLIPKVGVVPGGIFFRLGD